MAYVNQTNRGLGIFPAIGAVFAALIEAWRRARIYRKTYAELNGLSARELDDLGISRSMISRVAHEAAYGPKA